MQVMAGYRNIRLNTCKASACERIAKPMMPQMNVNDSRA